MNKRIRINGVLYEAVESTDQRHKLSFKSSHHAPNDRTGLLLNYELIIDGRNTHTGGITIKSIGDDTSFRVSVSNIEMDDKYVNAYTSEEWYEDAEELANKAAKIVVRNLGFDKTCRELKKLGFRIGTPGGRYPKGHVYSQYED